MQRNVKTVPDAATNQRPQGSGRRQKGALRRRLGRTVPLILITMALMVGALAVRSADPSALRHVRNLVFDEYQRLNPRPYDVDVPVRVVAIDEASLERIGQWPWSRVQLAKIIDRLNAMGAAAIAIDFVMAEADRTSPEEIVKLLPEGLESKALADSLLTTPRNDDRLAQSFNKSPVVLGMVLDNRDLTLTPGPVLTGATAAFAAPKAGFAFAGDDPRNFLLAFNALTSPLPVLSQAAAGLGAMNWIPDRDQVVRGVPLVFQLTDGTFVPSLAAEALRVAQGAGTFVLRTSNASGETAFGAKSGINAVRIGDFDVATNPFSAVRVHFTPTTPQRLIPAWWILEGVVDPQEVAGRIILIGATAPGLLDLRATPIDVAVPGVEIHAQLIEHILSGAGLVRPDWAPGLEIALFALLAVVFAVAAMAFKPLTSLGFGVITLGAVLLASYGAFVREGLLIDPSFPVLASTVVLLASTGWVAVREEAARRSIRNAFSRYVSADLVQELAQDPDNLALGGELKPMTILFTDMRGFTSISEGMDAVALTAFINRFLTPLTDVILAHRGTIDKYMGDAIMAFWNAPVADRAHAANACQAALAMLDALAAFNQEHEGVYPPVSIGIGVNTGLCCVGNLGSSRRFDYSVIGDDVNIASRLEGQTKSYGLSIILGPETAVAAATAGYVCIPIDRVKVKGKDRPIEIYSLLGGPDHPVAAPVEAAIAPLSTLVEAWREGNAVAFQAALDAMVEAPDTFQALLALYAERWEAIGKRFPSGWDGVATLTSK
ncbi:MAG: adenylate/guanylate cyclase domain-containing protein [Devosia sp.]